MARQTPETSEVGAGWSAWPAAESPGRTGSLMLAIAAFSILAAILGGDLLWGVTAVALLSIGLNRWFLPTTYEVDDDRLVAGYPLRKRAIRWINARRLVLDEAGGWLSDSRSGRRGRRGIDLYWGSEPERARELVAGHAERAAKAGVDIEIVRPAGPKPARATEGVE
ncbi:MAG: hypothetical protein GY895_13405 [Phycisphaera sp.]|nr:hypothetical protein [Phycisphaera sp.]